MLDPSASAPSSHCGGRGAVTNAQQVATRYENAALEAENPRLASGTPTESYECVVHACTSKRANGVKKRTFIPCVELVRLILIERWGVHQHSSAPRIGG